MQFADDKEYVHAEKNALYEQNMNDTDKYTMTGEQYQVLMQKEKQRELKEKEDKIARENLKKLEQEIDNQKYQ